MLDDAGLAEDVNWIISEMIRFRTSGTPTHRCRATSSRSRTGRGPARVRLRGRRAGGVQAYRIGRIYEAPVGLDAAAEPTGREREGRRLPAGGRRHPVSTKCAIRGRRWSARPIVSSPSPSRDKPVLDGDAREVALSRRSSPKWTCATGPGSSTTASTSRTGPAAGSGTSTSPTPASRAGRSLPAVLRPARQGRAHHRRTMERRGQIPNRFIELLNRPATNYWARRRQGLDLPPDSHQGPLVMLANGLAGSGRRHVPVAVQAPQARHAHRHPHLGRAGGHLGQPGLHRQRFDQRADLRLLRDRRHGASKATASIRTSKCSTIRPRWSAGDLQLRQGHRGRDQGGAGPPVHASDMRRATRPLGHGPTGHRQVGRRVARFYGLGSPAALDPPAPAFFLDGLRRRGRRSVGSGFRGAASGLVDGCNSADPPARRTSTPRGREGGTGRVGDARRGGALRGSKGSNSTPAWPSSVPVENARSIRRSGSPRRRGSPTKRASESASKRRARRCSSARRRRTALLGGERAAAAMAAWRAA